MDLAMRQRVHDAQRIVSDINLMLARVGMSANQMELLQIARDKLQQRVTDSLG